MVKLQQPERRVLQCPLDLGAVSPVRFVYMAQNGNDRDFRQEPVEWRELKEFVVDQLKRAGQRIDVDYLKDVIRDRGGNVDKVLDKLADKGFFASSGPRAPQRPRPPVGRPGFFTGGGAMARRYHEDEDRRPARKESGFELFHAYRKKTLKRAQRALTGFRVHFTAFAGVNIFLFILWLLTGAGHPWFLYPLGAWGIGLLSHFNPALQRFRQRREVEALPDLTNKETRLLRRMHRSRTGFAAHLVASGALSGYLVMINAITGGGFPWALIPTAVLGLGVFLHWSAYVPKGRQMKREIRGWMQGGGRRSVEADLEAGDREPMVVQEASALRRTIIRQIEEMEKDHPAIGADMRPLLDTYFQQVRQLAVKSNEIESLIGQLPQIELQQDRVRLKNRMEKVESSRLREEYEKSILEVDRQLASIKELAHNSEVLELRLTSAVNLMKQLQLDLARVKGASISNTASFSMLKDKSDELSRYIEDLESGYEELESGL